MVDDGEPGLPGADSSAGIERAYTEQRKAMITELRAEGVNVYPHKFVTTRTVKDFRDRYCRLDTNSIEERIIESVAGRCMRFAPSGSKLCFLEVVQDDEKLQVLACHQYLCQGKLDMKKLLDYIRRGDVIGVKGYPGRTGRGELSIYAVEIELLAPCYHLLPDKTPLKDVEVRYRQRYLDLLLNGSTMKNFQMRSRMISYVRSFFGERGFLEVETPQLNTLAGGATAKPFETFLNELSMPLSLRVAPELFLKMLVIGGMNKVFEIGKSFRNEGMDSTHNPEFTTIEFYWAFADYYDLIEVTEKLLSGMVYALTGSYKLWLTTPDREDVILTDFAPPYERIDMVAEVEKCGKFKLKRPLDSDENMLVLENCCKQHGIVVKMPATVGKLLDELAGHFIESRIKGRPAFITKQPQLMSPLAKWHREDSELTERAELVVNGRELCNFYTELNDPEVQRTCFKAQQSAREGGDEEAQPCDEDFCVALEYGLPPTAGWGMGLDRMAMLLTNNTSIKEVILFPTQRPLAPAAAVKREA